MVNGPEDAARGGACVKAASGPWAYPSDSLPVHLPRNRATVAREGDAVPSKGYAPWSRSNAALCSAAEH